MRLIIVTLILLLLASTTLASNYKTFIITDDNPKASNMLTFEVSSGKKTVSSCSSRLTKIRREYNNKLIEDKEYYEKCLKEMTKNWKTDTLPESHSESAIVEGFDEDIHRRYARRLWWKIRKGESCPKKVYQ